MLTKGKALPGMRNTCLEKVEELLQKIEGHRQKIISTIPGLTTTSTASLSSKKRRVDPFVLVKHQHAFELNIFQESNRETLQSAHASDLRPFCPGWCWGWGRSPCPRERSLDLLLCLCDCHLRPPSRSPGCQVFQSLYFLHLCVFDSNEGIFLTHPL